MTWGYFYVPDHRIPPVGGFLVARAKSMADLKTMFEEEPFKIAKLASYTFKEFEPVKRQPWTEGWFSEKAETPA